MIPEDLKHFPQPLLQDLLEGRWLPIVGAGFSLNAIVPEGKKMPLWDDLGRQLASEMEDYPYTSPIDAISAYAHDYSRTKLVERLRNILLIGKARPGAAHEAFAELQFDIVCTTNFDFLLERAYELVQRYCQPILDEDQLAITSQDSSIRLVKLHGDIHHPQRMIMTEEDYDLFLERYPLVATYLSSLMITRTPVFIGYSLDDPDFRMVWQTVAERLGRLRRQAYLLTVNAKQPELARYERRGVKPVNLPGAKTQYGDILAKTFKALGNYVRKNIIPISQVTEEEPLQELSLPESSVTRLCFFAIPFSIQAFYRDKVFPIVKSHGLVPMTAEDVISPGDNITAKIDALISRATAVVVDASNKNTVYELKLALSRLDPSRVLIIVEDLDALPKDILRFRHITRGRQALLDPQPFLMEIETWLLSVFAIVESSLKEEPQRLLSLRAYRSAVISAFTLLESELRKQAAHTDTPEARYIPMSALLSIASKRGKLPENIQRKVREWSALRNAAVHTDQNISAAEARQVVTGILKLVDMLKMQNNN